MQLAPNQAVSWSLRTLYVTGPLCLAFIPLLVVLPVPAGDRMVVMMVYLLLLGTTVVAAMGALFGACQFGTARAFAAGIKVGREIGAEKGPEPTQVTQLRLVD